MKTIARCPRFALLGLVAALGVLPLGCGRSGLERLPVGGTVSRAGGEKFSGTVIFLPTDGKPGPAAIASLLNGEYQFDRHNGPTAGPHRVIVYKVLPKKMALESRGNATASEPAASAASAKTEWTQSANVKAEGPYRYDFNLD